MEPLKRLLERIVGKERVSDEPVIFLAYSRDIFARSGIGGGFVSQRTPSFAVLPRNTEQVVKIAQVTKLQDLPITPVTTGPTDTFVNIPTRGSIRIDFKGTNRILANYHGDMLAKIQSCVTYAMLAQKQAKDYYRSASALIN